MKVLLKLAACAAAAAALSACGDGRGADGLTSEQRDRLNAIAENQDAGDIDTSPDSLVVANDEWEAAESGEAAATDVNAGAAPGANVVAPANAQ
jgi:hypothetical protein